MAAVNTSLLILTGSKLVAKISFVSDSSEKHSYQKGQAFVLTKDGDCETG
jgi:hypothetical protein